uniref:Reverse transcriptase domain-containing protein n=1 Tax=Salvator merianae TaxID=96440 RepID=A0A8D0C0A8_SALMN
MTLESMTSLQHIHMLKNHNSTQGYPISHKIILNFFADHIILFTQTPLTSIPEALNIFNNFSKISGLKLNSKKSELFFKNNTSTVQLQVSTLFVLVCVAKMETYTMRKNR